MIDPVTLYQWGYHLVPWQRNPRKPLIKGWLEKRVDPTGFLRAYGDELDWAIVPDQGVVVLDVEMKGGLDGVTDLEKLWIPSEEWDCPETMTKNGGFHLWFREPDGAGLVGGHHLRPGVEAKAINGSVHVPPSVGYITVTDLVRPEDLPVLPDVLVDAWRKSYKVPGQAKTYAVEVYAAGERRARLCSMAGRLRAAGLTYPELVASLLSVRDTRCADPSSFDDNEVIGIAKDYANRPERSDPDISWLPRSQI